MEIPGVALLVPCLALPVRTTTRRITGSEISDIQVVHSISVKDFQPPLRLCVCVSGYSSLAGLSAV